MKKLREVLSFSIDYLTKNQVLDAKYSAESIIAFILNCKRLEIYLHFEKVFSEKEMAELTVFLKRRSQKEPLAYLFNKVEFSSLEFFVDENVLIPRPETEEMVFLVEESLKKENLKDKILWDICTGSGCIGISLKEKNPQLKVVVSDLSENALLIAQKNAELNKIGEIEFKQGNLLEPFFNEPKADYIICNPPYVSRKEYENLESEVKDWEPKMAFIAEKEGLDFYEKLALELPSFLNSKGKVFFEIGYTQAAFLKEIFKDKRWLSKNVYKDLSGKERFFFLEIE